MNFLWHKVNKEEQDAIKKEAKQIMDRFAKTLARVEKEIKLEGFVRRKKQLREETEAKTNSEFRKRFLDNVPNKEGNWVKAEKGKWK